LKRRVEDLSGKGRDFKRKKHIQEKRKINLDPRLPKKKLETAHVRERVKTPYPIHLLTWGEGGGME